MSNGRKILNPYHSITAGDMSQSSIISNVSNILYLDNLSVELDWSGTPVGTFDVQVSNSYQAGPSGTVTNPGVWQSLTLTPAPVAAGSASSYAVELNQLGWAWLRVVYTRTSGTGSLDMYIAGKALG